MVLRKSAVTNMDFLLSFLSFSPSSFLILTVSSLFFIFSFTLFFFPKYLPFPSFSSLPQFFPFSLLLPPSSNQPQMPDASETLVSHFQNQLMPSERSLVGELEERERERTLLQLPLERVLRFRERKTLVLDLDETLVHSSLTPSVTKRAYDFTVEVSINLMIMKFYVYKRPYLNLFLRNVLEWYNVVIFTASLKSYANPVIDQLDGEGKLTKRLFRESCITWNRTHIKDLVHCGFDVKKTVIIDNSPMAYVFDEQNAVPIGHYFATNDEEDEELLELLPILHALLSVSDVRSVLSLRSLKNQDRENMEENDGSEEILFDYKE